MHSFLQIAYYSLFNVLSIIKSPLFWIVIGIIYFQYRKIGKLERDMIGGYRRNPIYNTLISSLHGLIGGVLGSIVFIYFDISIDPRDFYLILPFALFLSAFNPRYICFSYAGGLLSMMNLTLGWPDISVSEILIVIGVLHLIESFLILLDGQRNRIPIYLEREGNVIGGFNMNRFWPVPFLIFVSNGFFMPIITLAILGYGDFSLSKHPRRKSRETSCILFLFSIALLLLSKLSIRYHIFKYVAAIFAPLAHELIIVLGRRRENRGKHIFTPVGYGLRILDTMPDSIGERMGLNSGDIILNINGESIHSKEDIDNILYYRPKSIRMRILDHNGGTVFKEYTYRTKENPNLGIIMVPNIPHGVLVVREGKSIFHRILARFKRRKSTFRN